jgi:hypothetical protein
MDLPQKTNYIYNKCKEIGVDNVYFEPPEGTKIKYDCVVFHRGTISSRYADNGVYKFNDSYDLTHISRQPDSEMVHTILTSFKMIRHVRHFVADGLHHDQFKLYL